MSTLRIDDTVLLDCFHDYLEREGARVSRAEFEANLAGKLQTSEFLGDAAILLRTGAAYDDQVADRLVRERLITKLRGEPWKGKR